MIAMHQVIGWARADGTIGDQAATCETLTDELSD
jgi:hypothetical protein